MEEMAAAAAGGGRRVLEVFSLLQALKTCRNEIGEIVNNNLIQLIFLSQCKKGSKLQLP